MVAVFDVGNSFLHIGIYDNDTLVRKEDFPHRAAVRARIWRAFAKYRIQAAAISSVVPGKTEYYRKLLISLTGTRPMVIHHKLRLKLKIGYTRPAELGTDRIAAMVGGRARYGGDFIVVDFGTATTLDVVFRSGFSPGGIIMTGIQTGITALAGDTARLKYFKPRWPAVLLGRSTRDGMQSGAFLGTRAMIKGLVDEIRDRYGRDFLVIGTGGWAKSVHDNTSLLDYCDSDLVLYGIYKICQYNDDCR